MVFAFYSGSEYSRREREVADGLVNGIGRVIYYHASGMPISKSIRKSAESSKCSRAASMLNEVGLRTGMGQELCISLRSVVMKDVALRNMLSKYVERNDFTLNELQMLYNSERKENSSRMSALTNRYATFNMFISTIAPSFIIFSFIGSMLISQSAVSIWTMSFLLLLVVPIAYAFSSAALKRRLYG